jgi:Mn2+/Fe2+ NRAMP family transporter
MVARLGAVTGAGHARLIYERFGRRWGAFALSDLLVLNFLIIVTEFIGVAFGLGYFGVSRHISVPAAALVLIAVVVTGSFRRWSGSCTSWSHSAWPRCRSWSWASPTTPGRAPSPPPLPPG